MSFKSKLGLLTIAAAALMLTSTTASAQDIERCIADFELPVPAEGLCLDEGVSSDANDEDAEAFEAQLLASANAAFEVCSDSQDYEACTSCAVAADMDLSAGCSHCWVKHVECIQDNCADECGIDIDLSDDNEVCGQCIEGACVEASMLCMNGEEVEDDGSIEEDAENNDGNADENDPYGKTCTDGPDCKDGEWDVAQTGGRIGSSCALTGTGAGGGLGALLMGLGLVAQRRRRAQ